MAGTHNPASRDQGRRSRWAGGPWVGREADGTVRVVTYVNGERP